MLRHLNTCQKKTKQTSSTPCRFRAGFRHAFSWCPFIRMSEEDKMELQHTHTFRVTMTRSHRGDSAHAQNSSKANSGDVKAAIGSALKRERDACAAKRPDCAASSAAKLLHNSHWLPPKGLEGDRVHLLLHKSSQDRRRRRQEKISPVIAKGNHRWANRPFPGRQWDYYKWLTFRCECQSADEVMEFRWARQLGEIPNERISKALIASGCHQQHDIGVKLWTRDCEKFSVGF